MPRSVKSLSAKGAVTLDVIVGEAQAGMISVYVDNQQVARVQNELTGWTLGPAARLRGKILAISTTVLDVNPRTDLTSAKAVVHHSGDDLVISRREVSKNKLPINFFYVVRFQ